MSATWLVIANKTDAKIYSINKKEHALITSFTHPEGRMPDQDLISDRPGHYNTRGTTRGAYSPDTSHREVELEEFAQKITHFLDHEFKTEKFQHLIVCSEPHFYGLLIKTFSGHLSNSIKHHVIKDLIPLEKEGKLEHAIQEIQNEFTFG